MNIVCWNMAHSKKSWDALAQMADVDIALLQETPRVPDRLRDRIQVDERLWPKGSGRRVGHPSVVGRLSDRVAARALNEPDEWGPGDHCRILIELDGPAMGVG